MFNSQTDGSNDFNNDHSAGPEVLKNLLDVRPNTRLDRDPIQDLRRLIREVIDDEIRPTKKSPRESLERPVSVTGQRILNAVGWLEKITDREAFPPSVVSYFAGCSTVSSYDNARKALRRSKLIEHTYGGFVKLTEGGRKRSVPSACVLYKDKSSASNFDLVV